MNELIPPTIKMDKPNDPVVIYEGLADVKTADWQGNAWIKIFQSWFPKDQVNFNFKISSSSIPIFKSLGHPIEIRIDDQTIGEPIITQITEKDETSISGIINSSAVLKRTDENIKTLDFSLFNFRPYFGNTLKDGNSFRTGELIFSSCDHSILIHSVKSSEAQKKIQREVGGYIFTNSCRLEFNQTVPLERARFLQKRLGVFLSFINGRRTYPRFIKAYSEPNHLLWEDYTPCHVDQYKHVPSWIPFKVGENFPELWDSFLTLTKDDDDFEKIGLVIHWYLETLNNSGHTIGSIFMLQTAFEILYNWLVKEKKEINDYSSKDPHWASNKLRTLLNHHGLNLDLPVVYSDAFKDIRLVNNKGEEKQHPFDFCYWYTEIRNMFVHFSTSNNENRKNLPDMYDWYLLNTGIFNLEIILLKMLKYKGTVTSRLQTGKWRGADQVHIDSPYKTVAVK